MFVVELVGNKGVICVFDVLFWWKKVVIILFIVFMLEICNLVLIFFDEESRFFKVLVFVWWLMIDDGGIVSEFFLRKDDGDGNNLKDDKRVFVGNKWLKEIEVFVRNCLEGNLVKGVVDVMFVVWFVECIGCNWNVCMRLNGFCFIFVWFLLFEEFKNFFVFVLCVGELLCVIVVEIKEVRKLGFKKEFVLLLLVFNVFGGDLVLWDFGNVVFVVIVIFLLLKLIFLFFFSLLFLWWLDVLFFVIFFKKIVVFKRFFRWDEGVVLYVFVFRKLVFFDFDEFSRVVNLF